MAESAAMERDTDALSGLEERIQKAVTLVGGLRRERETLSKDLAEAQAEIQRLSAEIAAMRDERTQVRGRIENLLGHIDQLSL